MAMRPMRIPGHRKLVGWLDGQTPYGQLDCAGSAPVLGATAAAMTTARRPTPKAIAMAGWSFRSNVAHCPVGGDERVSIIRASM